MADLVIDLTAPNGKSFKLNTGLFINNEFVRSVKEDKITSINPATEKEIATVFAAGPEDIDLAVNAARKALKNPLWNGVCTTDRARLLFKLADLIEENTELLATIDSWDVGKPYWAALTQDLKIVVDTIRYYAGWTDKIVGRTIETSEKKFVYTVREPMGVCGQIIPWNFPLVMAAMKLGPALACGNTVVLKASEHSPLSILYLAQLIDQAGFPPGVVNIVNGLGPVAGAAIASHPRIDKIAYTGSTTIAREVMKLASVNLTSVTLENGGKSPLIVFEDADIDQAVKWAHMGVMYNAGQMCSSTSRILVQESVYNEFVEHFKKRTQLVSKIRDPFDIDTFQGPQVTKAQYDRVLGYIESGKTEGAKLICAGEACKNIGDGKGFYISPTIFTNVSTEMKIYKEEVFGPVAVLLSFKTEQEALEIANDTTYGLGGAVFTKDLTKAHRVARGIEAGMVWINSSQDADQRIPFGGNKMSGIGRETGEAALETYTVEKAIHVNLGAIL